MKIAKVQAHPNIALVKYWGKRHIELNLPASPSLSATLSGVKTVTQLSFNPALSRHELFLNGIPAPEKDRARVAFFLDKMINFAVMHHGVPSEIFAEVRSHNDFPTAAGLASSASGFSALALAVSEALELNLSPQKLSEWARIGSGSAARSIFGGWVVMNATDVSETAIAQPIAPADHWDLRCVICVTTRGRKGIGSTEAMEHTRKSSPYYQAWIEDTFGDVDAATDAVLSKDFETLTQIAERSCLRMHACAMSADPGIIYWNASTLNLISLCRTLRSEGLDIFFTIDAGPHVKMFYKTEHEQPLLTRLKASPDILQLIQTKIGGPAQIALSDA